MEITNVADMQDVETAVGEGDPISGAAPSGDALPQFVARDNLRLRMW